MLKAIDNLLNSIAMYRLVLYGLFFIWAAALALSFLNFLPFAPIDLIAQAGFLVAVCVFIDLILAWAYEAPTNLDSVYITALILSLIIAPAKPLFNLEFLAWAATLAMASKYLIAVYQKHLFNPAALAVVLTALALNQPANWWVANLYLAPAVFIVGVLIIRKIKRLDLVASFFLVALLTIILTGTGKNIFTTIYQTIIYSPLMFLAFIMLTEPLTTPPRRFERLIYGAIVGFFFAPAIHLGSFYLTPELALIVGNIFSYAVSPKQKLLLKLTDKIELGPEIFEFVFASERKLAYRPGQYLEWTLDHPNQDSRGIRRFFTISSSPTESDFKLGVKFYPGPSSFKKKLRELEPQDQIVASQLAGDFTLPRDQKKKLVFLAGGIGITPFRSMIKYLLDTKQPRDLVLFYSNRSPEEIVYKEIFDQAETELGLKTVYAVTDKTGATGAWRGHIGRINEAMIAQAVPDFNERYFYLSGPRLMVDAFKEILKKMGVRRSRIKTDYFPGFA